MKQIVNTRLGWFAGYTDEGDDIFTRDKGQAKALKPETAQNWCKSRDHLAPRTESV